MRTSAAARAVAMVEEAVRRSDYAYHKSRLMQIYAISGNHTKSVEILDALLLEQPDNIEAIKLRLNAALELRDQEMVLEMLARAARLGASGDRAFQQMARRAVELGLWALALAVLVVAIAEPTWLEESGRTEPGRVVVLVDRSASMAVLEDGTPRSAAVEAALDRVRAEAGDVEVFSFDEGVQAGQQEEGAKAVVEERRQPPCFFMSCFMPSWLEPWGSTIMIA